MAENNSESLQKALNQTRMRLERERARLEDSIERRYRTNRLYQTVTVASLGALIAATLLGAGADIVKQNIGIFDWLRSAPPASLVATFGSVAIGMVAVVFATYTYLEASARTQNQRAVRLAKEAAAETSKASSSLPAAAGDDSSVTAAQEDSGTAASPKPTPQEIADIANRVSAELASRSSEADSLRQIRALYETAQDRLNAEVNKLNGRALLNLIVGSIVTVLAALALVYVAVTDPLRDVLATGAARPLQWLELAAHYIPRLSIVIFLEVFAFFFLRLYRSTLAEVRLYQLDLTRLSTQAAAIELMFTSSNEAERAATAAALINVEWSGLRAVERPSHGIDPKLVGELANIAAKMASKPS